MDNKKQLLVIGGIIAVALVCVVVVGLINGVWPWQKNDIGSDYIGMTTSGTEDPTETTADAAENETGSSNTGNNGGTGSNTGTGDNTGASTQDPTVGIEMKDPSQSADEQEPTESGPNDKVSFKDLLDKANKGQG